MLPASYQAPAGIVLLVGGILSCFFGYRLFRIVLGFSGFVLGALAASSIFGISDTGPMLIAAIAKPARQAAAPLCAAVPYDPKRAGEREAFIFRASIGFVLEKALFKNWLSATP